MEKYLDHSDVIAWDGDLGKHRRARSELENLYAEVPDYEDVAERLGLL